MKSVLLIICAVGYGFVPAAAGFQNPIFIVLVPVSLGAIYFVLHRHDWPMTLVPWLFAFISGGRIAAYCWLNSRRGRIGPIVDEEVWIFGGLAAVTFSFMFWKWMKSQNETQASVSSKSS